MCSGAPPASNLPRTPPLGGGLLNALFFPPPPPIDWHAVARDAAVRIAAARKASYPEDVCADVIALVAEMRKRTEFGGGT